MYRITCTIHILNACHISFIFQAITTMSVIVRVFWDVTPCGLVHELRFRETLCLNIQDRKAVLP